MDEQQSKSELTNIYNRRFRDTAIYRNKVWKILTTKFFNKWIPKTSNVLDLGCGYGEFINNIQAQQKQAMDLNPESRKKLDSNVNFIEQDCSSKWPVQENSLDVVFTSNFFEHLPNKTCLSKTLQQAYLALKPGAKLIAMGPNIKFLPGLYWDFYDHHVILTELSLKEALEIQGFKVSTCLGRFLPFTMVNKRPPPLSLVKLYLKLPIFWPLFGRQFLVIAEKL